MDRNGNHSHKIRTSTTEPEDFHVNPKERFRKVRNSELNKVYFMKQFVFIRPKNILQG